MLTYDNISEMSDWFTRAMMNWWEDGAEISRERSAYESEAEWQAELDECDRMVEWHAEMHNLCAEWLCLTDEASYRYEGSTDTGWAGRAARTENYGSF